LKKEKEDLGKRIRDLEEEIKKKEAAQEKK